MQTVATEHLTKLIADAIHRSPMTQGQIADALNVQQGTISKWKLGTTKPNPSRFADVERVLQLEPGSLFRAHVSPPDRPRLHPFVDQVDGETFMVAWVEPDMTPEAALADLHQLAARRGAEIGDPVIAPLDRSGLDDWHKEPVRRNLRANGGEIMTALAPVVGWHAQESAAESFAQAAGALAVDMTEDEREMALDLLRSLRDRGRARREEQ